MASVFDILGIPKPVENQNVVVSADDVQQAADKAAKQAAEMAAQAREGIISTCDAEISFDTLNKASGEFEQDDEADGEDIESGQVLKEKEVKGEVIDTLTDYQIEAILKLDARGVSDESIGKAAGVTLWQLKAVRESKKFIEMAQKGASEVVVKELNTDSKWDALENAALQCLLDDVKVNGKGNMENSELIQLAKISNSAQRRHGVGSQRGKNQSSGPNITAGMIDASVRIQTVTLPMAFINHLEQVNKGEIKPKTVEQVEKDYKDFNNASMDMKAVGSILDIDMDEGSNKVPTLDKAFSEIFDAGAVSQVEG